MNDHKEQFDIYSQVTQKIITDLEKGELTWRKPWNTDYLEGHVNRPLRYNDIPYSGINTIVLWATAAEKNYRSPYWMTYRQAQELGAQVRPHEQGTHIVFADKIIKEEEDEKGEVQKNRTSVLRAYTVFNADQIEGLPEHFYELPEKKIYNPDQKVKEIEQYFANTKAVINEGNKAAYAQTSDEILMPPFESFVDAVKYYGTLSHEVTHWTKHPSRLNRDFNNKRFGDNGYALEELVAELGACFLAADLGFEPVTRTEHAAYIQSWLKVLKNDKRFIFQAASHAQKAIDYMNTFQPLKKENHSCLVME